MLFGSDKRQLENTKLWLKTETDPPEQQFLSAPFWEESAARRTAIPLFQTPEESLYRPLRLQEPRWASARFHL